MSLQNDAGSDTSSEDFCHEYVLYEKRFERLSKIEFNASCGELEDVFALDFKEFEVHRNDGMQGPVKHTIIGQGTVDATIGIVTFKQRPFFTVDAMQRIVMSLTHPRREKLEDVWSAANWCYEDWCYKLQLDVGEDMGAFRGAIEGRIWRSALGSAFNICVESEWWRGWFFARPFCGSE